MKQKLIKSLRLRLCALTALMLCAFSGNAWGETVTYTFNSKSWGDTYYAWTSGKDGNQMQSGRGIQVTTGASGANATTKNSFSNVSKIVVTYSTNGSSGAGSISFQVGTNTAISKNVTKTGGTTDRTLEYDFSPEQSGSIKISVTCTTNSIYVKSVAITYSNKTAAGLSFGTFEGNTYTVFPEANFTPPTLSNPNDLTVTYSSSDDDIALVDEDNGDIVIGTKEGTATITASSDETDTYAAGSAKYYIKVQKGTTSVVLNNTALTFNIIDGTTQTLTGTPNYNEEAIENASVTWSVVSGTDYARVSDAGVVTALAPGTATVRATYAGNTIYASSYADCTVTVNKANTTLTLNKSEDAIDLKNIGARTVTLTPTVKATKSDASQIDVVSPIVTWTSSDPTVATVADGVVTGLKVGTTTITAAYEGGTNYNAAMSATCSITVSDTRTPVNLATFTAAKTTLVIGDEQATSVTNDKSCETATYTYSSSNTSVATVAADGTISAVAKGTTIITATLSLNDNDSDFKVGETISKTLDIEVTNPFHTVTYSINGNIETTESFEEGATITFPSNPEDVNGFTFVGWKAAAISGTTDDEPKFETAPTMGNDDVTYYAVFAEAEEGYSESEAETTPSQTLQYDTWTYGGTSSDQNTYRLFGNGGFVASATFDLSKLMKVIVYGGTYGGPSFNSLTIGDGTNTWKEVTVSGSSQTGTNTYTGGTALSGTGTLFISSTCGTGLTSGSGIRISKVEIYLKKLVTIYSNYCTSIPEREAITLSFDNTLVRLTTANATYTQTANVSPSAYDGTISYSIEDSSTSTGANINSSSSEVSFNNIGSVIVKATAPATAMYQGATATYTIYVQTSPTITVSNQTIAQGETYSLDTSDFACGDITLSSGNPAIGSISDYAITGAAVGSTTITVTTAESDKYTAGSETFTLTVTAPTGETTNTSKETVFYESFDSSTGSIDSTWGNSSGSGTINTDNSGWTFSSSNGGAGESIKLGSSSNNGTAKTPSISVNSGTVYTLTFKAAPWTTESTSMKLSVTGGTATGLSTANMSTKQWNDLTATIIASSSTMTITFDAASQNRFFLDEVRITRPKISIPVTTTGRYATYCYQYPLNLDGIEGAKAYKVSEVDVENSKVNLEQITGTIKGGVPFILKSDGADDDFDIPLADESDVVPTGNALIGTLAPTFVAQTNGDYTNFAYSKSNGCFIKLNSNGNTLPANRAYLPINLGSSGEAKAFTLSFVDVDGISETTRLDVNSDDAIYNLAGQRLAKPQKGINIINGKKVLVK